MIIKEYRVPMPFTVEDYRIGQLYTIQKKSRLESEGRGGGVEIIKNEPYTQDNESGQYTLKIYHVDQKLPAALKSMINLLFPKSALLFKEEGWNRYPYTKTRYCHDYFKSFSIEIETKFEEDIGDQENAFNLSKAELANRTVDLVDIVNDQIPANVYKKEEDPKFYKSLKTGRGPISTKWLDELKELNKTNKPLVKTKAMCAYKLCRVECKVWGAQSRIEKTICETVIRNMLLLTHRQAWCWQDEYCELTLDDVRALEEETQAYLNAKMNNLNEIPLRTKKVITANESKNDLNNNNGNSNIIITNNNIIKPTTSSSINSNETVIIKDDEEDDDNDEYLDDYDTSFPCMNHSNQNSSINGSKYLDAISIHSNDEFFDAVSQFSVNVDENKNEVCIEKKKNINETKSALRLNTGLTSSSSGSLSSIQNSPLLHTPSSVNNNLNFSNDSSLRKIDTLILIVHGGNVLNDDISKQNDFQNIKSKFEQLIGLTYHQAKDRIAYRLVQCDSIVQKALDTILPLSPRCELSDQNLDNDVNLNAATGVNGVSMFDNLPFDALPLFACLNQNDYNTKLMKFIIDCNHVYNEFIKSNEGRLFDGQVIMIGDSIGSILAYDALCLYEEKENQILTQSTNTLFASSLPPYKPSQQIQLLSSPSHHPNYQSQKSCPPMSASSTSSAGSYDKPFIFDKNLIHSNEFISYTNSTEVLTNKPEQLNFDVSHLFLFGSPLGLVLAQRKYNNMKIKKPLCKHGIYNLFHLNDISAIRIEPLLCKEFKYIKACNIPRYSKYPGGDSTSNSLDKYIVHYAKLFQTTTTKSLNHRNSIEQQIKNEDAPNSIKEAYNESCNTILEVKKNWWGDNRIDYSICSPDQGNFQRKSLPFIFHSSYWESSDVVAFILRMILKSDCSSINNLVKARPEKMMNRLNRVKSKNLSSNHRANDVIVLEHKNQVLTAKFSYGPLDFALSNELVEVYISTNQANKEYICYGTAKTDSHGKIKFEIPSDKRLAKGTYAIKMKVKCDETCVNFNMAVLPVHTESVVFSIDGSFAANISLSGIDPKVRPGAVDVVRHWQEMGYLILYVSARPDVQKVKVLNWLGQHNFPVGMVYFVDGFYTEPLKQKSEILRNIVNNNKLSVRAAYGSSKDIQIYNAIGLQPNQIYVIGKTRKKYANQARILTEGYASHLIYLKSSLKQSSTSTCNNRISLLRSTFNTRQMSVTSTTLSTPDRVESLNELYINHYENMNTNNNNNNSNRNSNNNYDNMNSLDRCTIKQN